MKFPQMPTARPLAEFEAYFEENDRIIFSGPYGSGKSTFLKEFEDLKKSSGYRFIYIHPLNYQIETNRDIFEYVKRDIVVALYAIDSTYIKYLKPTDSLFKLAFSSKVWDDIGFDTNIGPSVKGLSIVDSINGVRQIIKKAKKVKNGDYDNFVKQYGQKAGAVYENNPISRLISNYILYLQEHDIKIALVIEDFDRLDPGQIFRLLNVLSSCILDNTHTYKNPFGLDKIILVCDYHNIESVYHHLYGDEADFSGYISKFSVAPPYDFSLKSQLHHYIRHLISEGFCERFPLLTLQLINLVINGGSYEDQLYRPISDIRQLQRISTFSKRFILHPLPKYVDKVPDEKQYFLRFVYYCKCLNINAPDVWHLAYKDQNDASRWKELIQLFGLFITCAGSYSLNDSCGDSIIIKCSNVADTETIVEFDTEYNVLNFRPGNTINNLGAFDTIYYTQSKCVVSNIG